MKQKISDYSSYYLAQKLAFGVVLMFLAAQIQIPIKPVPITFSSAGALVIALCYGRREAVYSIALYVLLGSLGAPIFSNYRSGVALLLGPSGGYLLGMILSTYLIATMRVKFGEDSVQKLILYSVIGNISLFCVGLAQLSLFVPSSDLLTLGLYPFILPGALKIIFTASMVRLLKK